jgi:hypothetical protein
MPAPVISKIMNANVYTGAKDHLGRVSEAKLPELTAKIVEHVGLGMIGTIELPAGLEAMSMTIKWAGYYADAAILGANPFQTQALQFRASHETYGADGRIAQVPLVIDVRGRWKKSGLGTLKPQEAAEYEDELAVDYVKVTLDKRELVEVDILNNIWKVDGQDLLADFRANLGGS